MPASVAEFAKAAEDSGILTAESLAGYVQGVAPDTDATALANRLVKDGRLTAFQAKYIYGGKANSLVLGPYVVLDMLGKGGMGYVYKAEHRKMRRLVALKVIAKTALKSPAAVRRFEREVQAAARLEHPNIVTAFDAGEAAGTHYLVMQFVDGRNLSEVVKELGPQPVGRAIDWIQQAAKGLAFAHEQGVTHRDIKPGNLLVDARGTVKILDMGLARLETLDADQDQLTGTGQIMGTVDYMAPEQAMDTRQADARSDIYSLGVTLWYLLCGRPLFEADSVVKKIMAHQQKPAPALDTARGDIPPEVEATFQRMVAKNPADRFQSMQEVIAALDAIPRGDTKASPPSISFRGGVASPGSPGTDATQTLQQQQVIAVDEDTARLSAINVDTNLGLKNPSRKTQPSQASVKPLHLAIGGGAVGALLVGLTLFAFSGRRDVKPPVRGGPSNGGSTAQSAPRRDAVASVAVGEPTAPPRTTSELTAPSQPARSSTLPPPAVAPFDATQARKHQEDWAKHLGIPVETTNSIGQTLVVIPPGRYTMGEGNQTVDVTLTNPFLFGQTEITRAQWRAIMATEPWMHQRMSDGQDYRVEGDDVAAATMTWSDAVAFCGRLTERERQTGRINRDQEYRLPTEAEWEFACRAGTATTFSYGADENLLGRYAWFGGGWNTEKNIPTPGGNTAREMYAHAVRMKQPNPFRLYDMHGNVGEWCRDWMAPHLRTGITDPTGPSAGTNRIVRGGSWTDDAWAHRSATRQGFPDSFKSLGLGFRVALSPPGASPLEPESATPQPISRPSTTPPLAVAPFDAAQARRRQEAWAKHLGIEVETTNSIGQTLIVIPPGRFTMGEADKTVDVTITKPYLLGETEVTQGQWKEVMSTEPWKGKPYTIEGTGVAASFVSWDDATAFCEKLTTRERASGRIGRDWAYRLPTEAEWEFACRAGTVTRYSSGDDESLFGDYAWFGNGWKDGPIPGGNSAGELYAHAVRLKRPNPFGLFDVHGNVWEWTADVDAQYPESKATDRPTSDAPSRPVYRGGSWASPPRDCRSAIHHRYFQRDHRCDHLGFRIALSSPAVKPPRASQ